MRNDPNVEFNVLCVEEMREHRKMLILDWKMSPEIVDACQRDIDVTKNQAKKETNYLMNFTNFIGELHVSHRQ